MTNTAEAIMDVAERRIREAGYNGFSFRDIAGDIGIKSAAVHYHFPTKEALGAAVARRYNDRIAARIAAELDGGADVLDAWRDVFRGALADGARMCLCGVLGTTLTDLTPLVADEVRRFFDLCANSLRRGGVPEPRITEVIATLEGAILMASVAGDAAVFDQATARLGEVYRKEMLHHHGTKV